MRKQNTTSFRATEPDAANGKGSRGGQPDDCDILVIGAGPIGLTLACALAKLGLAVRVLERQSRSVLAAPGPDGREIALTHRSADILQALRIWERIPEGEISAIREARVLNGRSPRFLSFCSQADGAGALGFLVPNHVIRRAAFAAASAMAGVELVDDVRIEQVDTGADAARVSLGDGRVLQSRLLIAADSRLSGTRRLMGIGADLQDFGRDVIVCHLSHSRPHQGVAYECFGHGRTLAMLPLNGQRVSSVLTAPSHEAAELMRLPGAAYARLLASQFGGGIGELQLDGERHAYPLVAVYAQRFMGRRFALAGDAAVGMHPVTAHGFNLGLYGIDALTRSLAQARQLGEDIGASKVLERYETEHRRATGPLYLGTNLLVNLFTDERAPARLARHALLRAADRLPPVKAVITRQLTGRRRAAA